MLEICLEIKTARFQPDAGKSSHLRAIGMDRFDFDTYIKKNNGNNTLDNYWVRFPDFGAKCFKDIVEKNYSYL